MANTETKATKPTVSAKEKRVDVFVPRGHAGEEPFEIVGVNGVLYKLPKGKTSSVPECVAKEYYRAQNAMANYDEGASKLREATM